MTASDVPVMEPCYDSSAKRYREQMAGSADATELPAPKNNSIPEWDNTIQEIKGLREDLEAALRKAAEAHEGEASEAAQASIKELDGRFARAADAAGQVRAALDEQVNNQKKTFDALPAPGDKLENGADVQLDPPEKSWWEDAPVLSWFSDYEERQEAFHATNEKARMSYQRRNQSGAFRCLHD